MGLNAVCIHGHFYQPPRDDPLSGLIPDEIGAEPFPNWNIRIFHECYQPNASQRNFKHLSFNFGPTLLKWIKSYDPVTYQSIIEQENDNYHKFGVGNGMAQSYHHIILPLANRRDKITQIKWGISDFIHRFGHQPQGMWLPETAVDIETLALLADNGIQFTILAPWQVEHFPENFNKEPYYVELPGDRDPLIVFLYNQNLSTSVSFSSEATRNAEDFVANWLEPEIIFSPGKDDRITLIASDGELYGHHKPFRDKFLSHVLNGALHQRNIEVTYPGRWLLTHKPTKFIKLSEYTSWSCHHGIIRWMGECDCTPGAAWKAPLRWGLERLADDLDQIYTGVIGSFTQRFWELRNNYIDVILEEISLKDLLKQYIKQTLTDREMIKIRMILAAQYERQRIFTSCGWFFENFHRIEPQNNIAYAAQAVWLTNQAAGIDLRPKAIGLLKKVKDQRTGLRGDTVFSERYKRIQDYSEDNLPYFNPSSNFVT